MRATTLRRYFGAILLAPWLLGGQAALAQQSTAAPPPVPRPADHGKTEEIVVTAQKRAENVRKVPLSVSVLSGAQIQAAHVESYADLSRAVPNLSFSTGASQGTSILEFRGISSAGGTSTVAIYQDDISLTIRNLPSEGSAEPRFLDIARVEALRGPQGTLYGASALGGALKYISNQPVLDRTTGSLYTSLSGTYHGGVNYDEQGVANIPVVQDKVAVRIAAEAGGDSGYINALSPATLGLQKANVNSTAYKVAKVTGLIRVDEDLSITPSLFYQKFVSHDIDASYLNLGKDLLLATPSNASIGNFQSVKEVSEPGHDSLFVPAITVNYNLGWADLTSISSSFNREFRRIQDGSFVNDPAFALLVSPGNLATQLNHLPSPIALTTKVHQLSQEVRLASKPYAPGGLPLTWVGGIYYNQAHIALSDTEPVTGINALFAQYGLSPNDPNVLSGSFPNAWTNDNSYYSRRNYDSRQAAIFGQGTWYVLPEFRFTAGLRYSDARDVLNRTGDFFYTGGPVQSNAKIRSYSLQPRFAFDWDITPDNTAYINIAKGFRLGSADRPVPLTVLVQQDLANLHLPTNVPPPSTYAPDKLWNYEIGDKARLFGGRATVSADFYYIQWYNIQQDIYLPISAYDFETNAGSATSYGFEVESRGRVTDAVLVGVSGSWAHARLDNGVSIQGVAVNGTFPGQAIEGVPEFNADGNVQYDYVINDRISGYVRGDGQWVGRSHGSLVTTDADYNRPSYVTFNASGALDFGRYEITLFGQNLSNNNKIIQRPNVQSTPEGFRLRPLTVGMTASVKF